MERKHWVRDMGWQPFVVRLPEYELLTSEDQRILAEMIRETEDYPVSQCWRPERFWRNKRL